MHYLINKRTGFFIIFIFVMLIFSSVFAVSAMVGAKETFADEPETAYYVNPVSGTDTLTNGSRDLPYKTL